MTRSPKERKPATPRHVVITPAHDEEALLPQLYDSLVAQSARPSLWLVVDDHSTDRTTELVEAYASEHDWIARLEGQTPDGRALGSKVAQLFLQGLATIDADWAFVSKIDADVTLPPDYFERLFEHFAAEPHLGIAGGGCYEQHGDELRYESVPIDHVRGALKTYRRACYDAIGGVRPVHGWDGLDVTMAQMEGWETRSLPELRVVHHRPWGSAKGRLRGRFKTGEFAHFLGYHPVFMALRCARHMVVDQPRLFAGASMAAGYLAAAVRRQPRFPDDRVVRFLRRKQLRRLGLGRFLPGDEG